MFYILVFIGIAVLLVVVVLVRNGRDRGGGETPKPHGTAGSVPHRPRQRATPRAETPPRAVRPRPAQAAPLTSGVARRRQRGVELQPGGALALAGLLAPADPEHRVHRRRCGRAGTACVTTTPSRGTSSSAIRSRSSRDVGRGVGAQDQAVRVGQICDRAVVGRGTGPSAGARARSRTGRRSCVGHRDRDERHPVVGDRRHQPVDDRGVVEVAGQLLTQRPATRPARAAPARRSVPARCARPPRPGWPSRRGTARPPRAAAPPARAAASPGGRTRPPAASRRRRACSGRRSSPGRLDVARGRDRDVLAERVDHGEAVHPRHVAVRQRQRDQEPVVAEDQRELHEREPGEVGRRRP